MSDTPVADSRPAAEATDGACCGNCSGKMADTPVADSRPAADVATTDCADKAGSCGGCCEGKIARKTIAEIEGLSPEVQAYVTMLIEERREQRRNARAPASDTVVEPVEATSDRAPCEGCDGDCPCAEKDGETRVLRKVIEVEEAPAR